MVVVVDVPDQDRRCSLGLAGPDAGIEELFGQSPVVALDLAVMPGRVGPDALVAGHGGHGSVERPGGVVGSVVGDHPNHPVDAVGGEEHPGPVEEPDRGLGGLIGQVLGVGQAGVTVDCGVQVDVARWGALGLGPLGGFVRRGSAADKAAQRAKAKGTPAGYVYLHSAVDGYSRLAYTEHLGDEKAITTIGFFHRARVFFAAHGINRMVRVITDNGPNYTARTFHRTVSAVARHQRIRAYTPRHNGKVERYNRTLAEELRYARVWTSEAERAAAITVWNIHYNYHRPHTAVGDQPPASRLHAGVTNVMSQNN